MVGRWNRLKDYGGVEKEGWVQVERCRVFESRGCGGGVVFGERGEYLCDKALGARAFEEELPQKRARDGE